MDSREFIDKLRLLPVKVQQYKVFQMGNIIIVKVQGMADYLSVIYKLMPDTMRTAKKKGMKMSFRSFKYMDEIDKMFLSKGFLQNMGYSIVKKRQFEELVRELCETVPSDETKLKSILENQ